MTRIDRRALFATGSAAALLAAVGVSAEARPQRGGHLRAALSGGDRAENWLSVPGGRFLQAARNAVFETLTELAPDGTLQPGLATAWHAEDEGRVWRLSLRKDALFHNGQVFTAEDAIASLAARGLTAHGDDDIRVSLAHSDPSFPLRLAQEGVVMFNAQELSDGRPTSGTGLYRMRRFDPGAGFLGERVETHRKDGQAGWVNTVELVAVSDENVRRDAVQDGIIDIADVSETDLSTLDAALRSVYHQGALTAVVRDTVGMPLKSGPGALDDLRFVERWWMTNAEIA